MKNKNNQKKMKHKKHNPRERVCERCGNGGFTAKKVFRCKYCYYLNGAEEEYNVVITRGGIDER